MSYHLTPVRMASIKKDKTYQFTILPRVDKDPLFYILDKQLLCLVFFDASHSNGCEVIAHCGFGLYFSMISDFE